MWERTQQHSFKGEPWLANVVDRYWPTVPCVRPACGRAGSASNWWRWLLEAGSLLRNRLTGRYARFLSEVCTFREPFSGSEITQVSEADEIAYCRMKLCTDVLAAAPSRAVYIEVEVLANPDNVSLAVVNFDAGGCSSVTFSPDTGAVIRERKVCEEPRKVQGAYIQPLMTITQGQGFEGCMGLYLCDGQLAFFRRHLAATADGSEPELGPWESTGFITDLEWAEGKQLTPCLAFRDEGAYHVRASRVSELPPVLPQRTAMAYEESNWSDLNWDADQEFADAEM